MYFVDWEIEKNIASDFFLTHSVNHKYFSHCCKEPHSILLIFSLQALVNAIRPPL